MYWKPRRTKKTINRIVNDEHPDVDYLVGTPLFFLQELFLAMKKKLYKMHNAFAKRKINVISEENAFVHVSGHL